MEMIGRLYMSTEELSLRLFYQRPHYKHHQTNAIRICKLKSLILREQHNCSRLECLKMASKMNLTLSVYRTAPRKEQPSQDRVHLSKSTAKIGLCRQHAEKKICTCD